MLSFEEKKAILHLFKLKEKKISNGKVNFLYPESKQKGQVLAKQLQQSGNGYVNGKYLPKEISAGYKVDARGWISIKEFSDEELIKVITEAMTSMSGITDAKELYSQKTEMTNEISIEPEPISEPQLTSNNQYQTDTQTPNNSIKKEVLPSTICGNLAYSYLNNWLGLTVSVVECSLLVGRMAAKKFVVVGAKR